VSSPSGRFFQSRTASRLSSSIVKLNHSDTVAVDIFEETTVINGFRAGVVGAKDHFLGLRQGFGDRHEKTVFKGGVVGIKRNGNFHRGTSIE